MYQKIEVAPKPTNTRIRRTYPWNGVRIVRGEEYAQGSVNPDNGLDLSV